MSNLLATIADRCASVCASAPFDFTQAGDEFSFTKQPTGNIDQVFRIEAADVSVIGGFNYTETRLGRLRVFLARKQTPLSQDSARLLKTDAQSLTAAVMHDGITGGGDYDVPDAGRGFDIQHDANKEYAVLRLTLPVNYEAVLA